MDKTSNESRTQAWGRPRTSLSFLVFKGVSVIPLYNMTFYEMFKPSYFNTLPICSWPPSKYGL